LGISTGRRSNQYGVRSARPAWIASVLVNTTAVSPILPSRLSTLHSRLSPYPSGCWSTGSRFFQFPPVSTLDSPRLHSRLSSLHSRLPAFTPQHATGGRREFQVKFLGHAAGILLCRTGRGKGGELPWFAQSTRLLLPHFGPAMPPVWRCVPWVPAIEPTALARYNTRGGKGHDCEASDSQGGRRLAGRVPR